MVLPNTIEVDETGAANIRSKTPKDLSHTILMVSVMLPNMAVIPTIPVMRNIVSEEPLLLKLKVNIKNIGKRRLQTTWRADLNDWRKSFSAM
jgi:hypothetical protein